MMLKHYQIRESEKLLLYEEPIKIYKGIHKGQMFLIELYKKRESKGYKSNYSRIDVYYCVIFKNMVKLISNVESLRKTQSKKKLNLWIENLNKKAQVLK